MWVAAARAIRLLNEEREELPDSLGGWFDLAHELGLEVVYADIPVDSCAFRIADVIVLQRGLSEADEIDALRHEVCHELLHPGNQGWWSKRPMGDQIVAKQERQANELSEMLTWELEEIRQAYLESKEVVR